MKETLMMACLGETLGKKKYLWDGNKYRIECH
jgi:hypothetical protein